MNRSDVAALVTRVFRDPHFEPDEVAFALMCSLTRALAQQDAKSEGDFARRVEWLHNDVLENLVPELFEPIDPGHLAPAPAAECDTAADAPEPAPALVPVPEKA